LREGLIPAGDPGGEGGWGGYRVLGMIMDVGLRQTYPSK